MSDHVESVAEPEEITTPADGQSENVEAQAESLAETEPVAEADVQNEEATEGADSSTDVDSSTDADPAAESGAGDMADAVSETARDEAAEETVVEPEASSSDDAEQSEDTLVKVSDDGSTRVVRTLAVDQEVSGTVKRITNFGAFIDIGVGRDGLIHISELSLRRVGKVTDVLSEGQEVTVWIKELDRARNRISLTMIEPGTKTIRDLTKGDIVNGTVTRILPYGAFVDIGIGRDALLHVREMGEGYVAKPEDVVQVGEELEARVVDLSRRRSRVDLSLKGLRPEPELEATAAPEAQAEAQADEVVEDEFEDEEVLTTMELAFKRAMEAGADSDEKNAKRAKERKAAESDVQEDIMARTLASRT